MPFVGLILRATWPFLLAGLVFGVQEVRIWRLNVSLTTSHKREAVLQSNWDAAKQRATDLALLYANTLPKIDAAARAQETADRERIKTLEQRVEALSRKPDLHFSSDAVSVWSDASAAANNGDAAPAGAPAEGTAAVPAAAYSEADVLGFVTAAAAAYRDAVRMFHEAREFYNAARAAQIGVTQ